MGVACALDIIRCIYRGVGPISQSQCSNCSRMTLATEKAWSDGALIDIKLLLGSKEQQGRTEQGLWDVRMMNNFVEARRLEGKAVVIGRDNHKWWLLLQPLL